MPIDSVQHKNKSNIGLIATTTVAGSLASVYCAAKNLPEKSYEISEKAQPELRSKIAQLMTDSFDMEKAKEVLKAGLITHEDFGHIKETFNYFYKSASMVSEAKNSNYNQIQQTIINAKNAFIAGFETLGRMSSDLHEKIITSKIFNPEKSKQTLVSLYEKLFKLKKEVVFKSLGINLAIGAGIGFVVGLGIKHLLNDDKS